jgi:hypothetical protein
VHRIIEEKRVVGAGKCPSEVDDKRAEDDDKDQGELNSEVEIKVILELNDD